MVGRTLGRYRILDELGSGGMGVVYRAHDDRLHRDVALKVLAPDTFADQAARKRFRKEALALSALSHPNVATVYDFDSEGETDFLVMEYIPGTTLSHKFASGPLPERDVTALGAQIASALEEAHDKGVVHRDLKPGNIMLTPKGQVKVLDFGLAKLRRHEAESATTRSSSATHGVAGTLPYMAPEQLRGGSVDARTDIQIRRGNHRRAIELLNTLTRYNRTAFGMRAMYRRGLAYLGLADGQAATTEFQAILDNRGLDALSIDYPLARLQLGRAAALTGDLRVARRNYEAFLQLWKDADPDVPIVADARTDYARVQ